MFHFIKDLAKAKVDTKNEFRDKKKIDMCTKTNLCVKQIAFS